MRKAKDKKIEVREIVYSQDDEKSFGDVFVYEPENVEEQNLGNLFIVGELKDLPRNCSYIMNILASKIKKEFYSNTKRTAEESLEAGLSEANKTLADLAEQGNGEYVSKLSMVCGTYRGSKLFLSQIGKIRSLLMRGGQIVEIVKEDSRKSISPKRAFNNIASGELSDGDLVMFATGGLFNVFSTEQLRQYGGSMRLNEFAAKLQEDIEEEEGETVSALLIEIEGEKKELIERSEIVTEKEKETAEASLEKALAAAAPADATGQEKALPASEGGSVIFAAGQEAGVEEEDAAEASSAAADAMPSEIEEKTETKKDLEKTAAAGKAPEDSGSRKGSADDIAPEAEKEEGPSPAPIAAAAEKGAEAGAVSERMAASSAAKDSDRISLSDIIKEYEKMENRKMQAQPDEEKEKNIEDLIAKKDAASFEDLDEEEGSVSRKISGRAKNILGSVASGISRAGLGGKLKDAVQGEKEYRIDRGRKRISSGSKKAIAAIALLAVAAGSYSHYSSKKDEETKAVIMGKYQSMLDDSKSKMESAEVASIAGSEENAGRLYIEARSLAAQVRDEYDALDAEADAVIAQAQSEIEKIDKVVKADDIPVMADFENEGIKNLAEANGTYYAVDGAGKTLYKVDAGKKTLSQVAKAEAAVGNLSFAKSFQGAELLLSDGKSFLSYNLKNGEFGKLGAEAEAEFADFATYGRYVYLLSPSDNQIYKYQKSASGLGNKTGWLKGADVSDAISLAIDQYIYVLSSGGRIGKYYVGEEYKDENGNSFAVKQPLDPLASPTKIHTSTDQKYIYVLEPSKQRVVIFDKATGGFAKQIVSGDFSEAKDFLVDAEEKDMTVLVKNKIVSVRLGE